MAGAIVAHGIEEVLIISGDAPSDMNRRVYNVDAEQAIRRFRQELPHVKVYAGLDPYRQSFARERDYLERKLEAGASGFFTQPFFDLRLMDAFADIVPEGAEVWWGATTVTEEGSLELLADAQPRHLPAFVRVDDGLGQAQAGGGTASVCP